jgi:hypothetical protein
MCPVTAPVGEMAARNRNAGFIRQNVGIKPLPAETGVLG